MPKSLNLLLMLFVVGFLVFSLSVYSQENPVKEIEEISTDRPDQTEASNTVPKGTVQIETGVIFQSDKIGEETEHVLSYPTTLVRIGILKWIELRLINQYISSETILLNERRRQNGFDAVAVGTKIYLCKEKGIRPEISLMGHMTLPMGSTIYRPSAVAPDFKFSLSNKLSDKFKIGYNIGWFWEDGVRNGAIFYTVALGYSISDKWGFYIEAFGANHLMEGENNHLFDGGFTFLARRNLQFDVSAGHKITANAPDYYLSTGFSWRLPK
jgi:hypothetical protein